MDVSNGSDKEREVGALVLLQNILTIARTKNFYRKFDGPSI